MSETPLPSYRFGPFELDLATRALRREGRDVALQDLPFRLLTVLVERAPALVSRDELRAALWPPGTHLDVDASLNTAVARVREALGDEPGQPRFVATVPRRGYKMVAPVGRAAVPEPPAGRWRALGLAVLLTILAALAIGLRHRLPSSLAAISGSAAAGTATGNVAREHLLIARHHAERRSREGLEKAIASFQSAIALDPDNAEAYSGLAAAYSLLGIYDFWRPREAFGPADTMARRALELDPASGEAHLAMGLVAAVGHWDWETARAEIERAVALAPDSAEAWYWRGGALAAQGLFEEAIASTETARALDPTSPVINVALGWRFFQARRNDEAIAQSHHAIELDPDYYDAWDNLKWIHLTLGHEAEAVTAWMRAEELDHGDGEAVAKVYRERGLAGLHRAAVRSQLEHWEAGKYQSPYDIALEYTALGEIPQAMAWLERSFGERETDLIELAIDPRLDPLRGEPRFQEILAAVGIPRKVPE